MAGNIYELQQALSLTAQTAINTPSASLIRLNSTTEDTFDLEPVLEDDSDEIGRGTEFAEQTFLTDWKATKKFGCYLSAEILAIGAAYGLGDGNSGIYTPQDPVQNANQIELPWMTVLETIRQGSATQIMDRALIGVAVDKFQFKLGKGPGRKNATFEMDLVGTGQFADPSGMTMPAKTPVHLLPAASLTFTVNGFDYIANRSFESFDFLWDNKLRDGFFPGSGFQTAGNPASGQIQGRLEFGKRELKITYVARYQNGSPELTMVESQTQGAVALGLAGATGYSAAIAVPQAQLKTARIGNTQGIITVSVEVTAIYDSTVGLLGGGLLTFTVNNTLGTVGR